MSVVLTSSMSLRILKFNIITVLDNNMKFDICYIYIFLKGGFKVKTTTSTTTKGAKTICHVKNHQKYLKKVQ